MGWGSSPGANIGENVAVFEAVHGSAPDIAGKGIANPTAVLLSSVMMLRHLNKPDAADRLQAALEKVYREQRGVTADLGGKANTHDFTQAVISALADHRFGGGAPASWKPPVSKSSRSFSRSRSRRSSRSSMRLRSGVPVALPPSPG